MTANHRRNLAARAVLAGLLLALVGCGGGGGSNRPASPFEILLSDGDTLPGGFLVGTIESANMANDRSVAIIASQPGTPAINGVFLRRPTGAVTPILTADSELPEGLSLVTVRNLAMSGGGDVSFELGARLDDDALYLFSGGRLDLLARTAPGATPPGFQILGERRIADGGRIAFVAGTSPCTVENSGTNERITCVLQLWDGRGDDLSLVEVPVSLEDQTSSAVTVVMDDAGRLVVGLPPRNRQSVVGEVVDGQYRSLLVRGQPIGDFGTLISAKPRAVNAAGAIVIDARFDTDGDTVIDQDRVLVLRDGVYTSVAETNVRLAPNDLVLQARGNAIDGRGRVFFTITYAEDANDPTPDQAIRVWDQGAISNIVITGQRAGEDDMGNKLQVIEFDQLRVPPTGEAIYRADIGYYKDGTRKITETRVDRWRDGTADTMVKTGDVVDTGKIVEIAVADLNDAGDLLSIAGINRRTNRALLLLPRS